MATDLHGSEDIRDRLLRLEKQNRRLKQLGAAALIIVTSLLVMGQAPSRKTVEANEFVLRDASGNVRARLAMNEALAIPEMLLLDEEGKPRVAVRAYDFGGSVSVFDNQGQERGELTSYGQGALVELSDPRMGTALLGPGVITVSDAKPSDDILDLFSFFKGPANTVSLEPGRLTVSDAQGFQAVLGINRLVTPRTGETHKTPANSLVLFDKDKNVIWKAP